MWNFGMLLFIPIFRDTDTHIDSLNSFVWVMIISNYDRINSNYCNPLPVITRPQIGLHLKKINDKFVLKAGWWRWWGHIHSRSICLPRGFLTFRFLCDSTKILYLNTSFCPPIGRSITVLYKQNCTVLDPFSLPSGSLRNNKRG